MSQNFDFDRPIYIQLVEQIQAQIVSGQYPPGIKLPSVRKLAAMVSVNSNTMQKAFIELERSGLVITQRTGGRKVTEDDNLIDEIRRKLTWEYIEKYCEKMQPLGYTRQQMIDFLDQS